MRLIIGRHAGFCFGVRRAVESASQCAKDKVPCATLGPLIHNPQEVARLAGEGIRSIHSLKEALPGETIMIRSHGVAPDVYQEIDVLGIPVIDATCPHVAAIHRLVKTYSQDGDAVIIVGESDHPEVCGIAGWAQNEVLILSTPESAEEAVLPEKALVIAQTTIQKDRYEAVLEVLRRRIPDLTIRNTICAATSQRQQEAEALSAQADVMLIVGGKNSSNTRKLYETCSARCKRAYLIETADDIPFDELREDDIVALTAGASTPQWLLCQVADSLKMAFPSIVMDEGRESYFESTGNYPV